MMETVIETAPRIGFAGVGWIGRNRLQAVRENSRTIIAGINDTDPEVSGRLKHEMPELQDYESFEEMLDDDLDGIVIATPSAMHAEQALAALQRGKAVFCQKPLGRNANETAGVVETARHNDLLLGVDYSYRYTDAMRQVKQVITSGELGRIYGVHLMFHNAYGPDKPWYYDPELSGGGCLIDLGVHLVDLLHWVWDDPQVAVTRSNLFHGGRPRRRGEAEDYAAAQLEVNGGETAVQLSCSWNLPAGREAVIEAAFYGEHGGVAFRNLDGSFYNFTAEKYTGTRTEVLAMPPDEWSGRAAVMWADRLAVGNRFDPSAERSIRVARTVDELYSGAES